MHTIHFGDLLQGGLVFSDKNDVLAPTIDNLSAKYVGTHIFGMELDNPILLSVAWVVSLSHLHLSHHELWD